MAISAGGSVTFCPRSDDRSAGGFDEPRQALQKGGFAGAGGSDDAHELTGPDGEVDVPEDLVVAVGFAEVVDDEEFVGRAGGGRGPGVVGLGGGHVRLLGVLLVVPGEDPGLDQPESEIEEVIPARRASRCRTTC